MKHVLLIFPGNKIDKPLTPLSILSLAAYLRMHKVEVEIFDARLDDYKSINFNKYLLIGFSVMIGERVKSAYEISQYIKQQSPKKIIVWGGLLPSAAPEIICQSDLVDIVVRKEGEETLLELVKCIEKNNPLENIKGITFKKDGKTVSNPDRPFLNMDTLPLPAYDLLNLRMYIDGTAHLSMETSRGCPHGCTHCFSTHFYNRIWRAKSAKRLTSEIKYLTKNFSVNSFSFWDNNFFVDKKRVIDFCKGIIKAQLNITCFAYVRPDNFLSYTDEEMGLVKRAGFIAFLIGAESGSQRVLDFLNKDMKVSDIELATLKCDKHGIRPQLVFMIGIPSETLDDIKDTIRLHKHLENRYPSVIIQGYQHLRFDPFITLPNRPDIIKESFKSLDDILCYQPQPSLKLASRAQRRRLMTISTITFFFYLNKRINMRGKAFQKRVLSTNASMLWKIFLPLIYTDALLRWKANFFYLGYEWAIFSYIVKNPLFTNIGGF